jgi:outer membrane lipase/esterase
VKKNIFVKATALLCVTAAGLYAQDGQAGALSDFVDNSANGASANVKAAGDGVQKMCAYLINKGYKPTVVPAGSTPSELDLFLRCNELVQTAATLQGGPTTANPRSLLISKQQLLGALAQVSGEEVAAQGSLATQVPAGQFANIGSRLSSLRYGTLNAAMRGSASALNWGLTGVDDTYHYGQDTGGDGYFTRDGGAAQFLHSGINSAAGAASSGAATSTAAKHEAVAVPNPWGLFAEGTYNFGKRDQSSGEDAYDFKTRSVTAGIDYNFGSAVAGLSIGYDKYTSDFRNDGVNLSGGGAQVKGTSGSLFGAWFGDHWTVNGIASYGTLKTDVSRVATYTNLNTGCTNCGVQTTRTFSGSPDGRDFAVGATAGYDLNAGSWNLSPNLSFNYRRITIDAYDEAEFDPPGTTGGLALHYDSQTIESLRSVLGVSASRPFSESFGVISPNIDLRWNHEFKDQSRTVNTAYLVDITQTTAGQIPVQTAGAAKDFGIVGVGLTALFSHRLQAYVTYERLIGISYLTSNSISVGIRGQL